MAEQERSDNKLENSKEGGRPPVLDEKKRRQIIALLANGSSRRVAAHVAGCATSTIARTAQRDPEFAARLAAAEMHVEIEAMQSIRDAAKNGRYCALPPGSWNAKIPATSHRKPPPPSARKTSPTWPCACPSPPSTT